MIKDGDLTLICRQCSREFAFSTGEQEFYELKGFALPVRCPECRAARQKQATTLICSSCNSEIDPDTSLHCTACTASSYLDSQLKFEQQAKELQTHADKLQSNLNEVETEKIRLEESMKLNQGIVAQLEKKISELNQELEKSQKYHVTIKDGLQPALNDIKEAVLALERAQLENSHRMLQGFKLMQEKYESVGFFEMIKRSFRRSIGQGA